MSEDGYKKLIWFTKINLFITLLIIITSVFLGIFFIKHETKSIEIELDERANTIAHYLAYNSEYGVLVGDKDILNRLLQGIIKEKSLLRQVKKQQNILKNLQHQLLPNHFQKK